MAFNIRHKIYLLIHHSKVEVIQWQNDNIFSSFFSFENLKDLVPILEKNKNKSLYCFDNTDYQNIAVDPHPLHLKKKDLIFWGLHKRRIFLRNKQIYKSCKFWGGNQVFCVSIDEKSPLYQVESFLNANGLFFAKVFTYDLEKGRMFNAMVNPLLSAGNTPSLIVSYNEDNSMQHWIFQEGHLLFFRFWKEGAITKDNQNELVPHSIHGTKKFLEKRGENLQSSVIFFCEKENPSLVQSICEIFPKNMFFLPKDVEAIQEPLRWASGEESRLFHRLVIGSKRYGASLSKRNWFLGWGKIHLPPYVYYVLSGFFMTIGVFFIYDGVKNDLINRDQEARLLEITQKIKDLDKKIKKLPLNSAQAGLVNQNIERSMAQLRNFRYFLIKLSKALKDKYLLDNMILSEERGSMTVKSRKNCDFRERNFEKLVDDLKKILKHPHAVMVQRSVERKDLENFQKNDNDSFQPYPNINLVVEFDSPLKWVD